MKVYLDINNQSPFLVAQKIELSAICTTKVIKSKSAPIE